jgi:hypothetical protein
MQPDAAPARSCAGCGGPRGPDDLIYCADCKRQSQMAADSSEIHTEEI